MQNNIYFQRLISQLKKSQKPKIKKAFCTKSQKSSYFLPIFLCCKMHDFHLPVSSLCLATMRDTMSILPFFVISTCEYLWIIASLTLQLVHWPLSLFLLTDFSFAAEQSILTPSNLADRLTYWFFLSIY